MPKGTPSIPLSRGYGGLNRFDRQASEHQIVHGLDVFEDDGDLRRRDAFHAIATGPPFLLPAGKTMVWLNSSAKYDREFTVAAASVGAYSTLRVYCLEPFDGIDWRHVVSAPTLPSRSSFLRVRYWNGSAWTEIPHVVDSTLTRQTGADGKNWFQSLCKDGRISWHKNQLTGWTTITQDSLAWYAVELSFRAQVTGTVGETAQSLSGTGSLQLAAPGPRAFVLEPIKSIFPVQLRGGRSVIVVASDRAEPEGVELGAQLGVYKGSYWDTQILHLLADEGAGVNGVVTWPQNRQTSTWPDPYPPGGGWANIGGGGTEGTADRLTKNQLDPLATNYYEWREDQFLGGRILQDVAPYSGIVQSATTRRGEFVFGVDDTLGALLQAEEWRNCRLLCIAKGAGGTPVGEWREILDLAPDSANKFLLKYHEHFSIAPDTDNFFDVYRPPCMVRLLESDWDYEVQDTIAPDKIQLQGGRDFAADMQAADNERPVVFELGRELRWMMRAAAQWSGAMDQTTRKLLLTNGANILSYDGIRLRPLRATSSAASARVQAWVGSVPDQDRGALQPHELAGSMLRARPPQGRFVVDYMGRTVVLGLPDRPRGIAYSAPTPDNDIWPLAYTTQIGGSDQSSDPITGAAILGTRLVVYTSTAIHVSDPPDDAGRLAFFPVVTGVGFVSHRAVAKIAASALIGVTPDGIAIFDGQGMTALVGDWFTLFEHGINTHRLEHAAAAVSLHRSEFYAAIPAAGDKDPERLLVLNYATRKAWLWRSPWGGITEIARDYDEHGNERMLFGTWDGHLAIMRAADTDDGDTITGIARTPSVAPAETATTEPVAIVATVRDMGPQNLTFRLFINSDKAWHDGAKPFDEGAPRFDAGVFGTAAWGAGKWATRKIPVKAHAMGEAFQVEIEGTGQWRLRTWEMIMAEVQAHRSR